MADLTPPLVQALAELQALHAAQRQPLRWGYLQALHRRAEAHTGAARKLLDAKLAQALHDCRALLTSPAPAAEPNGPAPPSPLAGLLAALQADAQAKGQVIGHVMGQSPAKAPPDLKVLRHFRASWARQRLDQQLSRSLARVPDNAGPLNTQRLLLQALSVMRAAAPEYLQRLMLQVDTLRWIERATAAQAVTAQAAARPPTARGASVRRKRQT